jgi:putative ABC transport system permease protein
MSWLRKTEIRLRAVFRKRQLDHEMDEEMRAHIEMQTQENLEAGMAPDEARHAALRQFGWAESIKETCRDQRGVSWLESFIQDARYAVRMLWKNPGFTAAVVATMALAVGATTVIYSFVHAILLRSLPYDSPHRIVQVWVKEGAETDRGAISLTDFADWKEQNRVFDSLAFYQAASFNLSGVAEAKRIRGARVSEEFFRVFRAQPVLGRTFQAEEDRAGGGTVGLVSYGLWQSALGGQASALGKVLRLDGRSVTVIGVMPAQFSFPAQTELWVPFAAPAEEFTLHRHDRFSLAVARLAPGVAIERAQTDMDAVAHRLAQQYPATNRDRGVRLVGLHADLVRDIRPALLILFGSVALVLGIACANVANLLLARTVARQRELAVRTALGADRGRVIRQLLTESVLLALVGGAFGVFLAYGGIDLFRMIAPAGVPRLQEVRLDVPVLCFSFGLSLLTGLLFGTVPAFQAVSGDLNGQLRDRGTAGAGASLARNGLVVAEVSLSMLLLIGAALLVKSLLLLEHVRPGFDPQAVVSVELHLPEAAYPGGAQRIVFSQKLLERLTTLSAGKTQAALVRFEPFGGRGVAVWFAVEGRSTGEAGQQPTTMYNAVTGTYFQIMGIPLLRGRSFTEQDTPDRPGVVLINDTFARRWFPNEDPMGRRMRIEAQGDKLFSVVGIVGDTHQRSLASSAETQIYLPYAQLPKPDVALVARAQSGTAQAAALVRQAIRQVDVDLPIGEVRTLGILIGKSVAEERFRTWLLASLALLAVVLAGVGIYGLLAYAVKQRTHEFGIRMALGAQRRDVLTLVLGQGMRLALAGIGIGLAAALALTRVMSGLLYAVKPTDPLTFVDVSMLLAGFALLACWLPARRAARAEPMAALRHE